MHLCCNQFLTIPGFKDRRRGPQRDPGARQVQLVASAQMERQHREDSYDGREGCQCSFLRGPRQVHLSLPSESHGSSYLWTRHCASGVHPGQASKNSIQVVLKLVFHTGGPPCHLLLLCCCPRGKAVDRWKRKGP